MFTIFHQNHRVQCVQVASGDTLWQLNLIIELAKVAVSWNLRLRMEKKESAAALRTSDTCDVLRQCSANRRRKALAKKRRLVLVVLAQEEHAKSNVNDIQWPVTQYLSQDQGILNNKENKTRAALSGLPSHNSQPIKPPSYLGSRHAQFEKTSNHERNDGHLGGKRWQTR